MVKTVESRVALNDVLELIANTTDGVYAVDETHKIILWNEAAQRILGYSAEEVLGKPCFELIAGRDERGNLVCSGGCADMVQARAGFLVPSRDLLCQTKAGNQVWLNVTNIPVPSELGGLSTVVHIFREVPVPQKIEELVERLSSFLNRFAASQADQRPLVPVVSEPSGHLTPREREVLGLLAQGANPAAIAKVLVISHATSRKHVQNILRKLNVHTTLEAVAYASRHDLLSPTTKSAVS